VYRFALRPRWIVRHVIVLVVVTLFALAGFWQIHRLGERRARNALVQAREHMPESTLAAALSGPATAAHRRVILRGRYDASGEVLLLGRTNGDRDGNHVLTPLVEGGGRTVIVDRGWVPPTDAEAPVREAAPPAGNVTVRGELLPSEKSPFRTGTSATHVVSLIDLRRLSKQPPYANPAFYVLLSAQDPAQLAKLPVPVRLPTLDEGPHFSYAVQWFSFIVIALVGYGAFLRREARRGSHPLSSAA
jgi:cytochrome oxidase assembly protein ShyY1